MTDHNEPTIGSERKNADSFEHISPAALQLSAPADAAQSPRTTPSGSTALLLGSLFGLLLCAMLAVIFLLPRWVSKPSVAVDQVDNLSASPATSKEKPRSPWQEAQLASERKAAQAVLEKLLESQFELQERSVQEWAGDEFESATQQAQRGDALYRERDFAAATAAYQAGLEGLDKLLAKTDTAIEQALTAGTAALTAGDAAQAKAKFDLVLRIDADNENAKAGLQRTAVLNEVLALVAAATKLEKDEKLEPALEQLQQALKLDAKSATAQQGAARVQAKLQGAEFAQLMSSGYQALSAGQHGRAIKSFQQALQVKADAPEAREALAQARSQFGLQQISAAMQRAEKSEQQEDWAAALEAYTAALAVDKNLIAVQQRLQQAQTRARLDQALQRATAQPERLAHTRVYAAAQTLYRKAQSIQQPGPKLSQQLETLQRQLRESQIPIAVQLESDNETDVTVLKVKHLGTFSAQQLSLKPGKYVAIGSRERYRDVRKEFRIEPGMQAANVVIQCVEKI